MMQEGSMALRYATERPKKYRILDLTSLTVEEFELLVPAFETAFLAHMQQWTLEGKPRTGRRYSQYANCPLPSPQDRLLFILTYLKQAATQAFHGAAFGMGQSKANQWIQALLPALHAALASLGDLPSRNLTDLRQRLADLSQETDARPFLHDGTERIIPRPEDPDEQTWCYSGKKKRHTVKNVLLLNAALIILFLSDTYEGSVHDKPIADATPYPLPEGSELIDDLGFVGYVLPGVQHTRPIKKPKGGELTLEQKAHNRTVARRRIVAEHVISSVKRCRIVKDAIRVWKDSVRDLVMEVCCGLHNFRVRTTPWPSSVA